MNKYEIERAAIAIVPLRGKGYLIVLPSDTDSSWKLFDPDAVPSARASAESLVLNPVDTLIYCDSLADISAVLIGVYGDVPGGAASTQPLPLERRATYPAAEKKAK